MKKVQRFVLTISLFIAVSLSAYSFVFANDDFQLRYAQTFSKLPNADWTLYLYEEFNFVDDGGRYTSQVHEPGIIYSGLAKWLDLQVAYVKVVEKSNQKWIDHNIPYLAVSLKRCIKGWSLFVKNRVEFDQKQKAEDDWYYRPWFVVTAPLKLTRFELQPFAANELFYNFDEDMLTANEFRSGFNFKINKLLSGAVYYLVKHSHTNSPEKDSWKRAGHVFATQINFSF